ncbi:ABC transporter permease [Nitrosophilus alvini]|uniref:ABC transporter permease n=1 Tax=Nitrosophilus alvini TaxID=2714855 RepID=UPI00190B5875|nr:ABC transporter permease [Nitrosophilus alvini]
MRLNVIKAYILKEFTELFRSKIIVMVYFMPTMIIILFGYGIRMEVTDIRTVILDYDNSKLSLDLISKFENSRYFDVDTLNISEKDALSLIKKAKKDIIIIIPAGFEKNLLKGIKSEIGIFIDASFPVRSTTMENYTKGVILHEAANLASEKGIEPKKLIEINQRYLFNQGLRDEDMIVPGLIGLVLLVAPAILSALLIVKEKEKGTIFNFYSSPVKKSEFLIAKLTPPFLLHSVNIFILFLWATYLFDVPFRGSFWLYWLSSELYIIISIGIGLLVSIITSTQIVAVVLSIIITIIPGFLYSGMLMPISSMEGESYIEAHIYPVMYYNHIVYDTFLVGNGIESPKNLLYLFILAAYGLFLIFLGSSMIKKELK